MDIKQDPRFIEMILALDVTGVLLKRQFEKSPNYEYILKDFYAVPDFFSKPFSFYMRPNLKQLGDFLRKRQIRFVYWTKANRRNTEEMVKILNRFLPQPLGYVCVKGFMKYSTNKFYTREFCGEKDLKIVEKIWGSEARKITVGEQNFPLKNPQTKSILVENTPDAIISGQTSVLLPSFNGDPKDKTIKDLCNELSKIIYLTENSKEVENKKKICDKELSMCEILDNLKI